ncbi:very short patch repair endonuclease [Pseudosporangium ferrugineum]|uniref:very short patch repair endonuclease n=1 Tax=Pseudosporangium ferrugineum TaxID=439699 RepID=UPI000D0777CB|nr:very short patch repair endonuclease [Pseudosporangium ferrugineum]
MPPRTPLFPVQVAACLLGLHPATALDNTSRSSIVFHVTDDDRRLPRPPEASSAAVRRVMQGNRSRDTRPELAVRRVAHRRGLRYRVNTQPVPEIRRRADLVFTRDRIAVFIDGCYWHGCPEHYKPAATNASYWSAKIRGNVRRDQDTDARLSAVGWRVIRAWEHEHPDDVVDRLIQARVEGVGPVRNVRQ